MEPACDKGPWAKVQLNMYWDDNHSEVSSKKILFVGTVLVKIKLT